MTGLNNFPLARYRFEFEVKTPIRLPDYAGSALRGAFGHALRQLSCMTRQKDCARCPLIKTCPYPAIFAPLPPENHSLQKFSQIPVPYVIEPPEWGARILHEGEMLNFHFVMIGRALKELPLMILAWRRALALGVGAGDGTAELARIVHCDPDGMDTEIYRPDTGIILPHAQEVALNHPDDDSTASTTLQFNTPLRLQKNGHALSQGKLDARTLLMGLVRRANLPAEFHGEGPPIRDFAPFLEACAGIRDDKNLSWQDWTRYSSRQRQKMSLGGAVGTWTLKGNIFLFAPYLRLGQWLHVGKEASFGLGQYRLLHA